MSRPRTSAGAPLGAAMGGRVVQRQPRPQRHRLRARLTARLRARSLDRQLAVGVAAAAGSPLAAHRHRITSTPERQAIAHALSIAVSDARRGASLPPVPRTPLDIRAVTAAQALIERLIQRLHAPGPVCERGMARLRLLLSDGSGPLYRCGSGDLPGRLGAALAEL